MNPRNPYVVIFLDRGAPLRFARDDGINILKNNKNRHREERSDVAIQENRTWRRGLCS